LSQPSSRRVDMVFAVSSASGSADGTALVSASQRRDEHHTYRIRLSHSVL
jgi:hypothetical protein